MTKRFKLYDEETLDTYIEDTGDCYSDGTPKSYWFGENEDFCNLFYKLNELSDENEELKKVLGSILLEVKRDISNMNQTGEITVFINPNSFNLISEVLRKYGALKEWYG